MAHDRVTRRHALKAGTIAALPLLAQPDTPVFAVEEAKPGLMIGISTLGFAGDTNQSLADELAATGFSIVQLFLNQTDSRYWAYNGRSDVSDLTAARSAAIADTYRSAGIAIHSIGVYTNLIHPDEAERKANLAYFDAMMKIGAEMGVHTFITEAGHYYSEGPAPASNTTSRRMSGT